MEKDDKFWLNALYLVFTVIAMYVGYRAINTLGVQMLWVEKYDSWFPVVNNILAVVFGLACTYGLASNKERAEYMLASIGEVRKVSWPTTEDTKKMTVIVVVVCLIFAAILGVFDFVWSNLLKMILT